MTTPTPPIKQIAAGRRKPEMTRKEYFDYRFRIHGSISDGTEDNNQKPHKYIQTQVFDAAFGARADGPLNANQNWSGRDDTTELYFRDWNHVKLCFSSDYVKQVTGPDSRFFADFETSIVLMALEKSVHLPTRLASKTPNPQDSSTVAMYFISTPAGERNGKVLEEKLTPLLIDSIQNCCQDDAGGLVVNIGETSEQFDLNAYFGGSGTPQYSLVYKIYLKDPSSVPQIRRSQKEFEALAKEYIDLHTSFILFSEEALVLDVAKNIRFQSDRQPVFHDLPGTSHLDYE